MQSTIPINAMPPSTHKGPPPTLNKDNPNMLSSDTFKPKNLSPNSFFNSPHKGSNKNDRSENSEELVKHSESPGKDN